MNNSINYFYQWEERDILQFFFLLYSDTKRQVALFELLLHEDSNSTQRTEAILKSLAELGRLMTINLKAKRDFLKLSCPIT